MKHLKHDRAVLTLTQQNQQSWHCPSCTGERHGVEWKLLTAAALITTHTQTHTHTPTHCILLPPHPSPAYQTWQTCQTCQTHSAQKQKSLWHSTLPNLKKPTASVLSWRDRCWRVLSDDWAPPAVRTDRDAEANAWWKCSFKVQKKKKQVLTTEMHDPVVSSVFRVCGFFFCLAQTQHDLVLCCCVEKTKGFST